MVYGRSVEVGFSYPAPEMAKRDKRTKSTRTRRHCGHTREKPPPATPAESKTRPRSGLSGRLGHPTDGEDSDGGRYGHIADSHSSRRVRRRTGARSLPFAGGQQQAAHRSSGGSKGARKQARGRCRVQPGDNCGSGVSIARPETGWPRRRARGQLVRPRPTRSSDTAGRVPQMTQAEVGIRSSNSDAAEKSKRCGDELHPCGASTGVHQKKRGR